MKKLLIGMTFIINSFGVMAMGNPATIFCSKTMGGTYNSQGGICSIDTEDLYKKLEILKSKPGLKRIKIVENDAEGTCKYYQGNIKDRICVLNAMDFFTGIDTTTRGKLSELVFKYDGELFQVW